MFFGSKQTVVSTDAKKIDELLTRGVSEVIPGADSLKKLLQSGKRLRIKLGIDPTSPHLHIGRSVVLLKLKDFQDLGHQIVFIIGDATGVVGDTSDKEAERPMLSDAEVSKNLASYVVQVSKILDKSRLEVRRNSEWLLKLTYREIGEHADLFSVSDFIARDNIKKRLDLGKRVSLREVLYPLMQGYDSVAVKADVELGGTDQRFNLLAGRVMQEKFGQPAQHILTTNIILGTDGRKMSSSWGNTINLNDEPGDMYGKVMSVPDELVETYFIHTTRLPTDEIARAIAGHPKEAKAALAREIVRMYHSEAAAQKAESAFASVFAKGEMPEDMQEIKSEGRLRETLVKNGIIPSNSEFARLVSSGAVKKITGTEEMKITDVNASAESGKTYKIGPRRFVKIV